MHYLASDARYDTMTYNPQASVEQFEVSCGRVLQSRGDTERIMYGGPVGLMIE